MLFNRYINIRYALVWSLVLVSLCQQGGAATGGNSPFTYQTTGTAQHTFFDDGFRTAFAEDVPDISPAPTLTVNFGADKELKLVLTAPAGKVIRINPAAGGSKFLNLSFQTSNTFTGNAGFGTAAPPVFENAKGTVPASVVGGVQWNDGTQDGVVGVSIPVNADFSFTKLTVTVTLPALANRVFINETPLEWSVNFTQRLATGTPDPGPAITFPPAGPLPGPITVVLPTATEDGSVMVSQDIPFPITANGTPRLLVMDEWVTSDGSSNSHFLEALAFTLNGAAVTPVTTVIALNDNALSLGAITANDGNFDFTGGISGAQSVVAGDVFTLKAGTYRLPADSRAGFNPQGQQTFAGKVFLTDAQTYARLSSDVQLGKIAPLLDKPTSANAAATTATLGGRALTDGGSALTERGVVYAPTATNADPQIGGNGVVQVAEGNNITGVFTVDVTNLTQATGYTFKAYAINAQGTSYTSAATFTTSAPAIAVRGQFEAIDTGDTTPSTADGTDFGTVATANGSVAHTFLIINNGTAALDLTGTPKVAISGANAGDFTVTTDATSPVAGNGNSTTFAITFDPSAGGRRTAMVTIASNDPNKGSYTFAIQGTGSIVPSVAVGLDSGGNFLVEFDPTDLTQNVQTLPISGGAQGEMLVGLDVRPATGELLGLGVNVGAKKATLYSIDPATGVATAIGNPGGIAFVDQSGNAVIFPQNGYDIDVNPVADKVRVVTASGLNFRLDPATGAAIDGNYGDDVNPTAGINPDGAINPSTARADSAAYTNSVSGATTTKLYTLDGKNVQIAIQTPPNSGTQTASVGLNVNGQPIGQFFGLGFDIASGGRGYGYFLAGGPSQNEVLARVDLATGQVSRVQFLGDFLKSLALLSTPAEEPALTGPTIANTTYQSATLGGNVTSDSGRAVTERGVLISKTSDDADPKIGDTNVTKLTATGTTGVFTVDVTGLAEMTQYTYRAYATNSIGTTYTSVSTFTTLRRIDFNGTNDIVIQTRGGTRIYPLANDRSPDGGVLSLVSVSDPTVQIDGRALVIPANYTGTFTYTFTDGTKVGEASVTVQQGSPEDAPLRWAGLLVADADNALSGRASAVRVRDTLYLRLQVGRRVISARAPASGSNTVATALGALTVTLNADAQIALTLDHGVGVKDSAVLRALDLQSARKAYNVALAGTDRATVPGGGYLRIVTTTRGRALLLGRLPDGRFFSSLADVLDNQSLVFYRAVPSGLLGGEFQFADLPATDLTGELAWYLPPQPRGLHRAGLNTVLTANGSALQSGDTLRLNGPVTVTLSGGDFPQPVSLATTATNGRVQPAGALLGWIVRPRSWSFVARIDDPDPGSIVGAGVYLPKSNSAAGFFAGKTVGGQIEVK